MSRGKTTKNQKKEKNTMVNNKKKWTMMNCIWVLNEKTQSIQWTKRPIGALVVAGSLFGMFHIMFIARPK
jgi:hypothetical protein